MQFFRFYMYITLLNLHLITYVTWKNCLLTTLMANFFRLNVLCNVFLIEVMMCGGTSKLKVIIDYKNIFLYFRYFFLAVSDVQANYLVHRAFQYTTLTSIQVRIITYRWYIAFHLLYETDKGLNPGLWIIYSHLKRPVEWINGGYVQHI